MAVPADRVGGVDALIRFPINPLNQSMGRSLVTLQAKHPVAELKAHYQYATNAVERRRAHVIWLLASGKPRGEVKDLTAYSLPSVLEAIHRYNKDGLNGLRDH